MKINLCPLAILERAAELSIAFSYVVGVHVGVAKNWDLHALSLVLIYCVYRITRWALYGLLIRLMNRYGDNPKLWPAFKLHIFKKR